MKKIWEKQELYDNTHPIVRGAFNPAAIRTVESIDEYALPIMPYLVEVGTIPKEGEPEDRLRQLFRMDTKGVEEKLLACEESLMKEFDGRLTSCKKITVGTDNFYHSFYVQFTTEEPLTEQDYNTISTILSNTETLDFLKAPEIGFSRYEECGPVLAKSYTWKHFGWQDIMDPWCIMINGDDEKDHFREAEIEMKDGRLMYRIDIPKDGMEFPKFASVNRDSGIIPDKFCGALSGYGVKSVSAMTYGSDCTARTRDVVMVQFTMPYDNRVADPHELAGRLHEAVDELKKDHPELMEDYDFVSVVENIPLDDKGLEQ